MNRARQAARSGPCVLLLALAGCAPRLAPLPAGAGLPAADFASAYDEATRSCRGVRTFVGVMALSGRAGRMRMRGNVEVGLEAPDRARLEAPGPFGSRPVFVFVARGESATLLLPRDRRVLRNAPPQAVIEALAGVALTPDQLRSALSGCCLAGESATGGRSFDDGWLAVDAGATRQWLRRTDGAWRLVASANGPLEIRYADFQSGRPSTVRIRQEAQTDITARLSQVDLNVSIDEAAFEIDVPPDAAPLTLEELRRAGPLGETSNPEP